MITKLKIRNFRCYADTTVTFQDISILVGRNNAGKSTLIEALKIISTVARKYRTLRFVRPPRWVRSETDNGVCPSVENQNISDRGLFNMYGDAPGMVEAVFSNGSSIRAYIGENLSIFALLVRKNGIPVRNAKEAQQLNIPVVNVLPQISSVLEREKRIEKRTVQENRFTRLTSRNFRNQLYYYFESFPAFKELVESTWEGLQVKPIELVYSEEGVELQFFVRDNGFEAEIGWMGHGLQMWVQSMWFISQCQPDSIVVLDEPDVYMHADLQRRLIHLVSPIFSQLIVATHSIEIMEEVLPESIIPVDCKRKSIKPIGNHSLVQNLVEGMGSSFNLDLARLFVSHRFLILEGRNSDRQLLSSFQSVLFPHEQYLISSFPKVYVEGWGGWQRAIAISDLFLKNEVHVKCYSIFDSDYHLAEDILKRKQDAISRKINLHIWNKKEIENYAIHPDVILRYIHAKKRKGMINQDILLDKMSEIAGQMKEDVRMNIASEIQSNDKSKGLKQSLKEADTILMERWKSPFDVVSGKIFIKRLALWSQKEFGVSFQAMSLIKEFRPNEVPEEMNVVINAIRLGEPFPI